MKKQSKTCIAVIKMKNGKLLMAGDRRASWDWDLCQTLPKPKIRKINNILIGGTGSSSFLYLVKNGFDPCVEGTLETYLLFKFKKELSKFLKDQGYKDEHNLLRLQKETELELLLATEHRLFSINLEPGSHIDGSLEPSTIEIDELTLPYSIGCGSSSALPILLAEKKQKGYNTREGLKIAMEIASEISPGCDNNIDFISED